MTGSRLIQHTDQHLQNYTVLQPKRPQSYTVNTHSTPFIMSCAWQLHGTENLHKMSHPITAAVLKDRIKGTPCILRNTIKQVPSCGDNVTDLFYAFLPLSTTGCGPVPLTNWFTPPQCQVPMTGTFDKSVKKRALYEVSNK